MKHRIRQFALTFVALAMLAMPRIAVADQPHMQAALQALEEAKRHLLEASHDKGGHRVKALKLTEEAIEHVKEGIRYDRTHGGDRGRNYEKDKR
jgi:hypothetical protein